MAGGIAGILRCLLWLVLLFTAARLENLSSFELRDENNANSRRIGIAGIVTKTLLSISNNTPQTMAKPVIPRIVTAHGAKYPTLSLRGGNDTFEVLTDSKGELFGDRGFWDRFHDSHPHSSFEWYGTWSDISQIVRGT
jgi:hypothetical protein